MTDDPHVMILVRTDIDRFEHNALFAGELEAALTKRGWAVRRADYVAEAGKVFAALKDPLCRFFIAFNGFGTELRISAAVRPGDLRPAFQAFRKPVMDLMHDCPAHESMAHQLTSIYPARRLLITDYAYAEMAKAMGVANVTHAPSITFPHSFERRRGAPTRRAIRVLAAMGTSDPQTSRARMDHTAVRGRLLRSVFDEVIRRAVADWRVDPLDELARTLRSLRIDPDLGDPDQRFLVTITQDFVKFRRRRDMIDALSGLPLTLIADRAATAPAETVAAEQVLPTRTVSELLDLMGESEIVLCPTTHMNGHHERSLCAFTAGAAVVSAPNAMLAAHFSDGDDFMLAYNGPGLRASVETLLADADLRQRIARNGHEKAMRFFSPDRLVDIMLNKLSEPF